MDSLREVRLEKARAILSHRDFKDQTEGGKRIIVETLVAKGLSIDDLRLLLLEVGAGEKLDVSYLESLPYDVFFNIVIEGGIKGADLIRLCGTSTILAGYCNASRTILGKEQKQFLFWELLRRMGKKEKLEQLEAEDDARELYKYYTIYIPKMFNRIAEKHRTYYDLYS